MRYPNGLIFFVILSSPGSSSSQPRAEPTADALHAQVYADKVQPFLKQHCVACHGPDKQKGSVRFDGPMPDLVDQKLFEKWLAAKRMIAQGEMPPEGSARPKADELIPVLAWIDDASSRAAAVTRGGIGRRALRRLTNREYVNSLMDVLGLSFPHSSVELNDRLPSDVTSDNFSNDSNQQTTQPLFIKRSLDLVQDLVDVALPGDGVVSALRYEVDLRHFVKQVDAEIKNTPKSAGQKLYSIDLVPGVNSGKPARLSLDGRWSGANNDRRPRAEERCDLRRGVLLGPNPTLIGNPEESLMIALPTVPDRGVIRLRVKAGAEVPAADTWPVLRLSIEKERALTPLAAVVIKAPADKPGEYVLEAPLRLAPADWKGLHRAGRVNLQIDNNAAIIAPAYATPEEAKLKNQLLPLPPRNLMVVESLVLEIEASATWPPNSNRVLAAAIEGEEERARAGRSLKTLLTRAFRHPPSPAEFDSFMGLYDAQRKGGASFLVAYKTAVTAVLIAPQMFYMIEPKGAERRPLTAWELAARLSYLVWNTTPDEELLDRAADGSLLTEEVLKRQLARLLDDPRSHAFCREFTRQWLDLDNVRHLDPPTVASRVLLHKREDIPWYETALRNDLAEEAPQFLDELLRANLPADRLVGADFVVVNDRLARFYEMEGVAGPEWRRVAAPKDRQGGLLTQSGCIAAASHAQQRAEIRRGVYLIERIIGIDIPTPPGNVQPLDVQVNLDKKLEKLTARQHIEMHSSINTCAVCHQRIDPLGYVWDNFDMYGRPRRDKAGNLTLGETGGRLPDKTPFANFDEFRKRLAEGTDSPSRFTDAFARRLLAYVLGRGLDHGDDAHLKTIYAACAKNGGGLRDLLTAMVLSEPFRQK